MRPPSLVIHCDWSTSPGKRWKATAIREEGRYRLSAPTLVGDTRALLAACGRHPGPVLVGFDFPIGLPQAYGARTGLPDFRQALDRFGHGPWRAWFDVADDPRDIAVARPFYPARPGGRSQAELVRALGVGSMDELRRLCERPTRTRGAACPLFWTLGGNQVGKAAIAGWREVVIPALRQPGTALWPFDGAIAGLLERAALILAETYPADAYGQLGLRFVHGMSKRRQADRRSFAKGLTDWARARGHGLDPELAAMLGDGFGQAEGGEDPFDAFLGLCGMLDVIGGHRAEGTPDRPEIRQWEGWIFGQADEPRVPMAPATAAAAPRPGEAALIARYFAPLAGPGAEGLRDDAARLAPTPGHDLVVTADAIVAGVHYLPDDPPASIARKALGVNASDLAAKGAVPRGFLLTLALPDDWTEAWLASFAEGLRAAGTDFGLALLGGDTVRAHGAAMIAVTAFGEVPAGTMVRRQGAKVGDRLCVTGTIGDAALGLRARLGEDGRLALSETDRAYLIDRYRKPQPRLALAPVLRRHARAAMDVSDGLAGDLAKMLDGVTARVSLADVPLSPAARRALAVDPDALRTVLTGGDDYEVLCAVPPEALDAFLGEARAAGVAASTIGTVEVGQCGPIFVDPDGTERRLAAGSFDHF